MTSTPPGHLTGPREARSESSAGPGRLSQLQCSLCVTRVDRNRCRSDQPNRRNLGIGIERINDSPPHQENFLQRRCLYPFGPLLYARQRSERGGRVCCLGGEENNVQLRVEEEGGERLSTKEGWYGIQLERKEMETSVPMMRTCSRERVGLY